MKSFLRTVTKKFLLKEAHSVGAVAYIQSLTDLVEQIRPSSKRDSNRLQLAKEQIYKLKRHFRKMEEHVSNLEEQLRVLEENKESK